MDTNELPQDGGRVDVTDPRAQNAYETNGFEPVADATDEDLPQGPAPEPIPDFWAPPPPQPRAGVGRLALAWFIAAMLGAGIGGGATYLAVNDAGADRNVVVNVVDPNTAAPTAGSENAPARVAAAVLPTIVQIQVRGQLSEGLGSGVIISSDGYILTNDHVVEGADEIEVNMPDGNTLPAALVGSAANVNVDIAVLKVAPEEPLAAAKLGSSENLVVGELAVAVGSPFGLDQTVTAGIISALHRNIQTQGGIRFTNAIQTDAPINPGNSGGALANSRGEIIGINTAIFGDNTSAGVGFAIPIDIARKVGEQIIEDGRAQLPFLGIEGDNLPGRGGAFVRGVEPGSAADEAGIREGDVIVELDGEAVDSMDTLIALLLERDVGEEVAVVVDRDGSRLTLTARLKARQEG